MNESKFQPNNVIMFWHKGVKHMCVIYSVRPMMHRGKIIDYAYAIRPDNAMMEIAESRLWNGNHFDEVIDGLCRL